MTPKQERYCQLIVEGKSQADAYREAYAGSNMSDASIYVEASRMMDDPNISLRIEQLRLPIAERVGRTLEQHIERLMKLGEHGESLDKVEAAIKAEELIGKVLGFYVNKTELTGKDGGAVGIKIEKTIVDPAKNNCG